MNPNLTVFALSLPITLAFFGCDGDSTAGSAGSTSSQGGGGSTSSTAGGGTSTTGGSGGSTGGTGGTNTGGSTGGSTTSSGGTGGSPLDCQNLPIGPLTPQLVTAVFNGSEDIAFDGKGHIAGKQGAAVILVDSAGQTTQLANNVPDAYGLRYLPNGLLIAALPSNGKLVEISPAGAVADYAGGLATPNGVYPDFDGNVWVTEFGGNKVTRINPDKTETPIISGAEASSANGIVLDKTRNLLFYTNYGQGRIRKVDLGAANFTGVEVIQIPNAKLDGLVMDACGHLYVVDQGGSDLYRVQLDPAGNAMGTEELLASFPKNVANAQFGSGSGFDNQTLYVAGVPGSVYSINVGVPGAPVPTVP
ncbi:MAG: gluconolactonase [Polyangiaceae bacterium]|nr:gluconolactonase [Polyangiaceae bacterium]